MKKVSLLEAVQMLGHDKMIHRNTMVCPICGYNTCRFNFAEDLFNCPCCNNFGGGVLDYWIYFRGITAPNRNELYKKASKDINMVFHNLPEEELDTISKKTRAKESKEVEDCKIAPITQRNKTYKALLSRLSLSQKHRQELVRRGLNAEEIRRYGYKTIPKDLSQSICKALIRDGFILKGVPGFYKVRGEWAFGMGVSGILIPQKNSRGMIQGFQIRTEIPDAKYMSLSSSGKDSGTKSYSFTHLSLKEYSEDEIKSKINSFILTEGPLKADIINAYTGVPVLAIPGVNSISYLKIALKELQKKGLKKIGIAFDMDYHTNKNVKKALRTLKDMLDSIGMEYKQYKWDSADKGLDDYLYNKYGDKRL